MKATTNYRKLLARYAPQPIRSAAEYRSALAQLEKLMVPHPDADRGRLIELLATLIEKYESRDYPNPQVSPAEMLAQLLKTGGVRCAALSRATGIPTATLSNVLARRRGISKRNAIRLAKHFGLSPIVFLAGVEGDAAIGKARSSSQRRVRAATTGTERQHAPAVANRTTERKLTSPSGAPRSRRSVPKAQA
jgi:HTH-type transcriptional regulator/antitoxin HigA